MQLFPGELEDLLLTLVSFSAGAAIGFVASRNWRTKLDSTVLFQLKHPLLSFSLTYFFLFFLLALDRDLRAILGYLPVRPHSVAYAYLVPLALALPIVIASLLKARRAA